MFLAKSVASTHPSSTAAHRTDDLDLVALTEHRFGVLVLRRHLAIQRDRGEFAAHSETRKQPFDREPVRQLHRIAVHRHVHGQNKNRTSWGAVDESSILTPRSLRWNYPEQVRGVPGRTRFSGNLPPRRKRIIPQLRAD